ncbi:PI-PLC X domain-containing protein At5g67130 [Mangifera indica]|uniref:PI-PLC X domain-containing protein At5g67130 n=1 Tax=Mangifera indica TaxID=29780 RepID=UPI001CF97EB9|nr:PI-PLC X domain-containing protein At5g67130 [Mangifera indica]
MAYLKTLLLVLTSLIFSVNTASADCSNGQCRLRDKCSSDSDCQAGLFCSSCALEYEDSRCVRSTATDPFKLVNNTMPFNKYAFLTTHNSFARTGKPRLAFPNQEDSIIQQLNNGVRALMLDTYDFKGDIWLCHSFNGKCFEFNAFQPARDAFNEIEAFLSANPSQIVTLILEDYVETPNGLTKVFNESGLMKYWFPVSKMPQNGQDWPLVKDMVASNQRLLVFTSKKSKQDTEGIAYQWNYMVENQYGNDGTEPGVCSNRGESAKLDDKTKSLVLVNHFGSAPFKQLSCVENSEDLIDMLNTCYGQAGNRWANFVAVNYYKRSSGGGPFEAVDRLNGKLLCGRDNVHSCVPGSS